MSSEDEGKEEIICAVCSKFEPQAWRKKFCKNCFHSIDEHSGGDEKETDNEKVDNEKGLKKSAEKEPVGTKTEKNIKDKLKETDETKVEKSTPDSSALKDKSLSKNSDKTSALAEKISKKLSGSTPTDKTSDKTDVKKTATNNLKSKFETRNTEIEKQSDKNKLNDTKSDTNKTKTWGAKSKFETKTQDDEKDEKTKSNEKDEKDSSSKKDEQKPEAKKTKIFTPPPQPDTKLKWHDSWGPKLTPKKDENKEKIDEKTNNNEKGTLSTKDSLKSKFESKDSGNLWGAKTQSDKKATDDKNTESTGKGVPSTKDLKDEKGLKEKEEKTNNVDNKLSHKFGNKFASKETEKSKFGDKITSKEPEKSKFGDKITSKEPEKSKFGDKITSKEPEKSKFGEKIATKEPEKSKFGDKITTKEPDKSKFGDKLSSKEPEKSKFGDKISTKEPEKSKFGDKLSSKEPEKSKFGDKISTKEPEKSKFGDKFSTKESEKSKFGDKFSAKESEKSKFGEKNNKDSDKAKIGDKSKSEEEKSKTDNKNTLFGPKSKFEKFSEKKETNVNKTDQKSDNENKSNEKLEESKLKLDIKKAASVNKTDSIADRMKDKYEKISKTPTSIIPSKTNDVKAYTRSKSDGAKLSDKFSDNKTSSSSPKIKTTDNIERNMTKQENADDKKSESLENDSKSPVVKHTLDQDQDHSGTGEEVNEDETSVSLTKLNTDEINKIKEAAKFLLDDDFDDARYNSLGRRNKENKSTSSQQATTSLSSAESEADVPIQGKTTVSNKTLGKENNVEDAFNKKFSSETEKLKKQLKLMEERCAELEEENKNLKNGLLENEKHSGRLMKQKQDVDNNIKALQKNLTSIESKCSKLESENEGLVEQIRVAKAKCNGNEVMDLKEAHVAELEHLRKRLKTGEEIVEALREDNASLRQEIIDIKGEMEEMYDTFRDQEAEEFRDVQREMEMHAKNCRVLSFKLRKYERVNEQLEAERENLEDKIQALQNQISDGDTRAHIRDIEDELRLAKEVSVRLHDELDILEEKKCKCEEENSQLTQILEQSDKKQFRLEMELDKLRDQVTEMKKKLADKSTPGTPVSQDDIKDRRELIGRIGQQGSQEQDISQLTRDLYDSMERETDLKDQLQFAEENIKDLRKKKDELEEENENLSVQLKKMTASKVTKYKDNKNIEAPDFTEDEIELKVQLELNEQELMVAKRKIQDLENENEKLLQQGKLMKDEIVRKEQQLSVPLPPSSPNTYYEDKIKELNYESDELKWKIIEKDREIEKLSAEVSLAQNRQTKMRKSRSLETDFEHFSERKKHLDLDLAENADYRDKVVNEVRGSPDQLVHRKLLASCCENQDSSSSPEDANIISFPIPTLLYTRSKPTDSFNVSSQSVSRENVEQLRSLQRSVESLQHKITSLEFENSQLKEQFDAKPEPEVETREELMEKILDMEEDIDILNTDLKKKDAQIKSLQADVTSLRNKLDNAESQFRKKELELLRDLDIAQEKNDILSNLLDIVKERADGAEAQLERLAEESQTGSTTSENSARTVSVISDVSFGSDEVFSESLSRDGSVAGSPDSPGKREKRLVIQKDWEGQFRKRIHCLERILAEERQKLAATEKKLALVSTETLSTAMSDDAKLHEREKEILQSDLNESKKHLRIANDQIIGFKERILTLEEENSRLQTAFLNNKPGSEDEERTPSGIIDTVLSHGGSSGSVDTVLSVGSADRNGEFDGDEQRRENLSNGKEDVQYFRERVASLEARLEEANDIWKSKSSATEKEKEELEEELKKMSELCDELREAAHTCQIREETASKQNKEYVSTIKEKNAVIERKDEIIQEHEEIIKHREDDMQQLLDQISQRDRDIRELRENIKQRDERLKEKEDILESLNLGADEKQEEINYLTKEMSDNESIIKEKDDKIKDLEDSLKNCEDKNKESNMQLENERLNRELEDMAYSIGKVHTDNNTLQAEMEKTKQALSEAMVLWNKDRSTLGQELTVTREKLALFEASFQKKESQAAQLLRKEAHKYLEQREKLQHELRISKVEHDANVRTLKNEKLKLQDELTQTIRQLTTEMSNNDKMSADLERLKNQEEIAYQIQHHEKVLRAEYMAMKVRFETRLENLQKEHTKLLTILDQMQHEKVLNQEIIKGVQKQMSIMKENYNKSLDKLKQQNEVLERHMKELEGARDLATDLQSKVDALRRQLEDQEYERAELVDKITAERTAWELERSKKQSKINQLEEKLAMINNAQSRTKDMQSRMEVAWNRERAEQRRLLEEAHTLAIDLQKQLKVRDEEHMNEKRMLLDQLKRLRKQLDDEQISYREQISKQGTRDEQLCDLERKLREVQEKAEKEHEMSMKDQADLVRRLGEMRRQHKRDQRMMEDVLSGLTRLRELASIVVASENNGEISDHELQQRLETLESGHESGAAAAEEPTTIGDIRQRINEVVLRYIKEALKEIYFAAENIARPREVSDEEVKKLRRSLSSSELDALKEDFVVQTLGSKELEFLKQKYGSTPTDKPSITYSRSISGADVKNETPEVLPGIYMGSMADRKQDIMSSVHKEQGLKMKFPDPPPSFLLPRCINTTKTSFSTSQTKTVYSKETTTTSIKQIPKSISIDTCLLSSTKMSPQESSPSATNSTLSFESTPCDFRQVLQPIPVTHTFPAKNGLSASAEIVTPRTARKQFFADNPNEHNVHHPWPTRSRSHDSVSKKEKEHIVSEVILLEHDHDHGHECVLPNLSEHVNISSVSDTDSSIQTIDEDTITSLKDCKNEKKKRKAAKRSISFDSSTVKSTLAKAGVSIMSPAAPSAMSPSEIFAAVKRKLKPNVKRSSSLSEKEKHSVVQINGSKAGVSSASVPSVSVSSQEMKNTFEPPLSGLPPKSVLIPPPTPPISSMQRKILPVISDDSVVVKRTREENKKDKTKKRPRSKSAERARTGPSSLEQPIVKQDIIPSSKILGFETSV